MTNSERVMRLLGKVDGLDVTELFEIIRLAQEEAWDDGARTYKNWWNTRFGFSPDLNPYRRDPD